MKKYMYRSILWTSVGFILIMLFCIFSIVSQFSYVDFVYLLVVVGFFVVYLRRICEM